MPSDAPGLARLQADFHRAVTGPEAEAGAAGLADTVPAGDRLAVYRSNIRGSLARVLRQAYPSVERVVGAEFFRYAAETFALARPPRRPQLLAYGGGFADFLAGFEPVARHVWLPDLARLDWARHEAYFGPEAAPLAPARLGAIPTAAYAGLRFRLHATVRIIHSRWPIVALAEAARTPPGDPLPRVEMDAGGETALVVRPHALVETTAIEPADAVLLDAIGAGATLAEAATQAYDRNAGFDLQAALAAHLARGTFASVESVEEHAGAEDPMARKTTP